MSCQNVPYDQLSTYDSRRWQHCFASAFNLSRGVENGVTPMVITEDYL